MAVEVMAWAFEQQLDSPAKKLLLLAIANHASPDGTNAWPSIATLARKTGISARHVRRLLRELEEEGWIATERQAGGTAKIADEKRPNLYTVRMGPPDTDVRPPRTPMSGPPRTPMSAKPSREPSVNLLAGQAGEREPSRGEEPPAKTPRQRPQDAIWEALVAAVGLAPTEITRGRRGALNTAAKQLREVGATAEEITTRAVAYRARWPKAALTETALAKHWSSLGTEPQAAPAPQADPDCPSCHGTWWTYTTDGSVERCQLC